MYGPNSMRFAVAANGQALKCESALVSSVTRSAIWLSDSMGPGGRIRDLCCGPKSGAAEGTHPFTFGSYCARAKQGLYSKVTATWKVEGGPFPGCHLQPETNSEVNAASYPYAEKTIEIPPPSTFRVSPTILNLSTGDSDKSVTTTANPPTTV